MRRAPTLSLSKNLHCYYEAPAPLLSPTSLTLTWMLPRARLSRHTSPMAAEDLEFSEWERSKISNQDVNLLKKLGLTKKDEMLIFPDEESFPTLRIGYRVTFVDHLIRGLSTPIHEFLRGLLFVYGLQLHQLTPNSILHISIFITLCECFLGTPPNWGCGNASSLSAATAPTTSPKIWLYIREEHINLQDYNIAPFDGSEKILRHRSWDAEPTDEEKVATNALMKRIHELQNTRGKEFSGIQITAYFLRIRVQPLQARKNPFWMYAGDKDADRLSKDLSVKDLEKLVRRISSLNKKDTIPTSCRVEPYSGTNALPKSVHSLPSSASPRNKRKSGDVEDSGTSKPGGSPAEETAPEEEGAFCPYEDAIVSSGEEEEEPPANVTAPTSTSQTLVLSEAHRATEETSPLPHQDLETSTPVVSPRASSPKRARIELGEEHNLTGSSVAPPLDDPLMQHFISLGTQFIGYRDTVNGLKEALVKANKRADDLAVKLEQSEKARKKAEQDVASVGDLRKRLHEAETALSEKITQQLPVTKISLAVWSRKIDVLSEPEGDHLLDALSLLEIHGDLARRTIVDARTAFTRLFPYFFPKQKQPETFSDLAKHFIPEEDLALNFWQENLKIGVEGTIALVAESQQNIDWAKAGETKGVNKEKWKSLIKAAKPHSKKILSFLGYKPAASSSTAKPELVFDNYTAAPGSSDALPAASFSRKTSIDDFVEDFFNADLLRDLDELRQQLQSMKKQALVVMEQSRKSSEREKIALQQAHEALTLKESTVAEAAKAASREDYMLDLMTDASLDMAGSFLDVAAEDQRVDARSDVLVKLAVDHGSSFWVTPDQRVDAISRPRGPSS
ncbi:hypothetical protein QYE76_068334 [Lolium multiflorum]|uniref:Transposase (putative) gypsy type domain-containing protein n=1 Tax=Lolium multiflorum TaxID=4521 RepID=A0AAD8SF40_LOLMU|nr:hypothetical protein QYE76_068334 [Lolium multiflorum]